MRWCVRANAFKHFNPRSSCEERLAKSLERSSYHRISIHAPHARSDCVVDRLLERGIVISIHAPHARSDSGMERRKLPLKISIHAPHARSDSALGGILVIALISIHAPHARSDSRGADFTDGSIIFQSTLLMRGATVSLSSIDLLDFIIHFSRTQHLFPKTLLLTLCPVSSISCVMALRA